MELSGCFLRAVAVCCIAALASATPGCITNIDSSSHMFGGGMKLSLKKAWMVYTQEAMWRNKGDITNINVLYDNSSGCLQGIRTTFGHQADDALQIGTEGAPDDLKQSETLDLDLQGGEVFIKANYKYNDQCVEYLELFTNRDRTLAIGNSESSSPMLTSRPIASKGAFLGFFKGYTDMAHTDAKVGQLQHLQLVWAVRTCDDASKAQASNPNPSAPLTSYANPSAPATAHPNPSAAPTSLPNPSAHSIPNPSIPLSLSLPAPTANKCTPAAKHGCSEGKCPTSACPLTGLGLELPILCYGTNSKVLPLHKYLKPCTNLACKLDKPSCTSFGVLGVGSYCTGTVVAMADEANLHPVGKLMVGYPCIEHTGPLLDIVSLGKASSSAENQGVYMAKAWKTCDCLQGISAVIKTMSSKDATMSTDSLPIPDGTFLGNIFNISLPDCDIETMVKQWVSAAAIKLPLPKLVVPDSKLEALKAVVPGFKIPSLMLPEISVPLLKLPEVQHWQSLPVVKIPASAAAAVAEMLDVTTLATLLVPSASGASAVATTADGLTLPDFTIDGIKELAAKFQAAATQAITTDGLSTLQNLTPANLNSLLKPNITLGNLDLTAVISQWVAANTLDIPVPVLNISALKNAALKVLIPGFKLPCMVVHTAAEKFVQAHKDLPLFAISNATLKGIGQVLPDITSLATILVDKDVNAPLPSLKMGDVTIPNFPDVAFKLSAALLPDITIPGLPSPLPLLNIQSVNLNGLIAFFNNLDQLFSSEVSPGTLQKLRSTLGEVASAVIPDSIEASLAGFTQDAAEAWEQMQAAFGWVQQ